MNLKLRLVLTVAAIVAIASAFLAFDGQALVLRLFERLDEIGPWVVPLFILIDALVVVLVLPGVIVTMSAGFLFGVLQGTAYVVIATATGASIAFFLARRLFGEQTARRLRDHPKLRLIDRQFSRRGWQVVALSRLIPFFPFKLSNYVFGVSGVSYPGFLVGTLIGIVPFTMTNVYLGSITADLATLGTVGAPRSWVEWSVYAAGFVVTIGVLAYFVRLARRAFEADVAKSDCRSGLRQSNLERGSG